MNGGCVIGVRGVSKRFDDTLALDDVSFALDEGEFFALLGPSGCGKTTLLRIIAGFEAPDQGEILLDGNDITALGANRRPVNLMFQSYALFPHMTVRANVSYGLEMEKLSRAEIKRRVDEVLEMTELTSFVQRKPDQLSGGQRQRVALARALVKRPRVLLLDEPLGALDRKLREQMQIELKRLQTELALTFVVVTHDQEEALVMADRIALMHEGKVVQLDSPEALYERPSSRFAADFIGVSNFVDGRVVSNGLNVADVGVLTVAEVPDTLGQNASLVVRPERIRLSKTDKLAGYNALRGTIKNIAYHGQDRNLHVVVQGMARPLMARVSAADDEYGGYTAGQEIWCNWRPQHGRIVSNDD